MKNLFKKIILVFTLIMIGTTSGSFANVNTNEVSTSTKSFNLQISPRVQATIYPTVVSIDINGGMGNNVQLWQNYNAPQQRWRFENDPTKGNNVGIIRSAYNNSVLTWDAYSYGNNVISTKFEFRNEQYWEAVKIDSENYIFRNYEDKKYVLDSHKGNISVYPYNGDYIQHFKLTWN